MIINNVKLYIYPIFIMFNYVDNDDTKILSEIASNENTTMKDIT